MDLQSYLRVIRKHWGAIPVVMLVVLAVTAAVTYLIPKTYQSQLQFFVSTVDTGDNSQLAQGSSFLQQRVKSYSELLTSPAVLAPVIEQTAAPAADDLAEQITVSIPTETVLIDVTVEDRNPRAAQRIATAIGEQFPETVAELEKVSTDGESPVKVTMTKPPTFDADPVTPRPLRNLSAGLVLGAVLALGAVVLREALDTRIRTKTDVEAAAPDVAIVGSIPFDGTAAEKPLLQPGQRSARSEAFRALRTNLAFVGRGDGVRSIVMTSTLPGEGKTTTAANLALVLAETGTSVCLVETDLRRPRLLEYFGLEGAAGLTDVLIGRAELSDLLQPYGRRHLSLLGAGQIPPNPSELLSSPRMEQCLKELADRYDYVLLDAPPLLPVTDAAILSAISDGAMVVVGSGLVTRDQFASALESLAAVQGRILGVALNRLPSSGDTGQYDYYQHQPRRTHDTDPAPTAMLAADDTDAVVTVAGAATSGKRSADPPAGRI